ncbi:MAG: TolC family outer membrane protein [Hyphomicrobiaceae bacterium]|nr:TolC family outer membrane protein [Hyphomicrobiaceae bacterium]
MTLRVNRGAMRAYGAGALAALAIMLAPQVTVPAHAETLLDAVASAYQYNPQLDAERARLRATDEEVARANSGYRPQIGFSADVGRENFNVRPATGAGGTTSPRGYTVDLVQPVFRGFQTTNAVSEAESLVRAGRENLRGVEQQVLQAAISAFADVVAAQNVVRLRQGGLEFFNQELKATKDRFAVGEVTRTDVAQAEARRALAVGDLDASQANLKSARAQFEQIVGHAPRSLVDPGWNTRLLPRSLNEAIAISAQENPEVVGALYREQAARFTVDRIRGELLPTAQLEASYTERFDGTVGIDKTETGLLVGRVNVPIYTGGEVEARVRQAKHTHVSRIQEIEQARALAQSDVAKAWAQLQGAKAQLISDKAQIEANRTALNGVREEEKVGQRTLLDVLNARQELLVSEIQQEATKRNVLVATYAVIAAIGRLNVAELGAVSSVYDPVIHADEVRRKWFGIDITHDDGRTEHHDVWEAEVSHESMK